MKKRMLYIIFTIFLLFLNVNIVNADNCADIQKKIDEYNYLNEQLKEIDCNDSSNETNVVKCNDNNINKNLIISELMKLDEENVICDEQKKDVNKIIEENKDKCGKIFEDSFNDFINGFMIFFYVLGPILLIFFGSLDFAKATVSSDQEALKKAWKNFSKRLAATVLLFLAPTIVNIIISLNTSDKYLSGNAYSCDYKYLVYTKEYNIKYVPTKKPTGTIKSDAKYIWMGGSNYAKVTSAFGKRNSGGKASTNHNGIDVPIPKNANIYAVASGVIVNASGGCYEGNHSCNGGAGNYVVLQVTEPNGNVMQYTYMHNTSLNVKTGDNVNQGDVIAKAGNTGNSYGSHCHFKAYNVTKNLSVNALTYTYGGLENISAIDEQSGTIVKINVDATMSPGSWSANAGTKWNTYTNCRGNSCSGEYNVKE